MLGQHTLYHPCPACCCYDDGNDEDDHGIDDTNGDAMYASQGMSQLASKTSAEQYTMASGMGNRHMVHHASKTHLATHLQKALGMAPADAQHSVSWTSKSALPVLCGRSAGQSQGGWNACLASL